MSITQGIFRQSNLGGILAINLFRTGDNIIQDDLSGLVVNESTMIYFSPETASYRERQKSNEQGRQFQVQLDFTIPKVRSEVLSFIRSNAGLYFNALVTDANRFVRRFGTRYKPLLLEIDSNAPAKYTSFNSASVSLAGNMLDPAGEWDSNTNTLSILTSTNIMYESLENISLTADTPAVLQLPDNMDLKTMLSPSFFQGNSPISNIEVVSIDPTNFRITVLSEITLSNLKMNLISKSVAQ